MLKSTFPAYQSAWVAARWGCFSCLSPLNHAKTQDMGYPPGRGQFAIQCDKCAMHTFFDLLKGQK